YASPSSTFFTLSLHVALPIFFIILTALFNSIFARLLLVAALDRRLPRSLGKLDENRVPLNAIIFQTTVAVLFAAIVFLLPYLISDRKSTRLNPVTRSNRIPSS